MSSSPWNPSPTRTATHGSLRRDARQGFLQAADHPASTRRNSSDDEIRHYVHHPEYLIRHMVSATRPASCDYMFPKPGKRVRPALLEEFSSTPIRASATPASAPPSRPSTRRPHWSQRVFDWPSAVSRTPRNPGGSRMLPCTWSVTPAPTRWSRTPMSCFPSSRWTIGGCRMRPCKPSRRFPPTHAATARCCRRLGN